MNRNLSIVFVALALGICVMSGPPALAQIKVAYNYHLTALKGSEPTERDIPYILHIDSLQSKFYSPPTEYKDSLLSMPAGEAIFTEMLHEAIRKYSSTKDESVMTNTTYRTHLYVFKDNSSNTWSVYDHIFMQGHAHYQEPIEEINWELTDSTKTILGYDCHQARAQFRGREWTVWFTPEIPIQEGPWKLHGLPGLILEASEQCGHHIFTITGIERTNEKMHGIYSPERYDKTDRISLLRAERSARLNGNASFAASFGSKLEHSSLTKSILDKYDFLETDYR